MMIGQLAVAGGHLVASSAGATYVTWSSMPSSVPVWLFPELVVFERAVYVALRFWRSFQRTGWFASLSIAAWSEKSSSERLVFSVGPYDCTFPEPNVTLSNGACMFVVSWWTTRRVA